MEKGGVHTLEGIISHRLSKEMIQVDLNQTYVEEFAHSFE